MNLYENSHCSQNVRMQERHHLYPLMKKQGPLSLTRTSPVTVLSYQMTKQMALIIQQNKTQKITQSHERLNPAKVIHLSVSGANHLCPKMLKPMIWNHPKPLLVPIGNCHQLAGLCHHNRVLTTQAHKHKESIKLLQLVVILCHGHRIQVAMMKTKQSSLMLMSTMNQVPFCRGQCEAGICTLLHKHGTS